MDNNTEENNINIEAEKRNTRGGYIFFVIVCLLAAAMNITAFILFPDKIITGISFAGGKVGGSASSCLTFALGYTLLDVLSGAMYAFFGNKKRWIIISLAILVLNAFILFYNIFDKLA